MSRNKFSRPRSSAFDFAIPAAVSIWCVALAAIADPKITPDVVYGHKDGLALTFDAVEPESGANGAGVLFMVSGGWVSQWAPPEESWKRFKPLVDSGFTVFLVRHGSSPRYIMPEAVADVRRAVRFIRANGKRWGVDRERLGVFGGSAGGHLSLMLGLASEGGDPGSDDPILRENCRVAAVVAYYPPTDLRVMTRGALAPQPGDPAWLKRPLELPALNFDPALAPEYSPILFVSGDDPPTLLVHGTKDELVPTEDSRRVHAAMNKKGAKSELLILEEADHSFEGDDARRAAEAMTAWFVKHLGGEKKSAMTAPKENAMKSGEPRIPPLKESEWTEGQRELLRARAGSGPLYNVFTTFATHEELYRQWMPFAGYILRGSTLAPRDRELAILRIGWLCGSEYEWGQHARIARTIGMSEEEIAGTTKDISARAWSADDAALLRAVDELRKDSKIGDATWKELSARYNTKQMMDLVFTVGEYNLVSMALNSFGVQLDEGLKGFPGN